MKFRNRFLDWEQPWRLSLPQQQQRLLGKAVLCQRHASGRLLHTDDGVALRLFLLQVIGQLRWFHLRVRFKRTE